MCGYCYVRTDTVPCIGSYFELLNLDVVARPQLHQGAVPVGSCGCYGVPDNGLIRSYAPAVTLQAD